jgi:hypothetical protein
LHRSTKGKEKFTVREEEEKGESQRRRKRVSKKSFGVLCVFVHTSLQQKHKQESSKIEQVFICKLLPLLHLIPS